MHIVNVDLSVLLLSDIFQLFFFFFPETYWYSRQGLRSKASIPKRGRGLGKCWFFFFFLRQTSRKQDVTRSCWNDGQRTDSQMSWHTARQLYYLQRVSSDTALQTNLTFSLLSGEIQRSITVWTESAKSLQSAVHVCQAADSYSLGDLYFSSFEDPAPLAWMG